MLVFLYFLQKHIGEILSLCYNNPNILKIQGVSYEDTIYFSQRARKNYD